METKMEVGFILINEVEFMWFGFGLVVICFGNGIMWKKYRISNTRNWFFFGGREFFGESNLGKVRQVLRVFAYR
jgi:hypothetical protein